MHRKRVGVAEDFRVVEMSKRVYIHDNAVVVIG